ncbi:ESSS subunit of NADH:ubiquinone oxidoreductase (complex I) [Microdochium nivale]|nr:ESSS subunit of NADH:ubiquinone oxidoreductase (complex I) [Microdochium nivale]
MPAVRPNTAIRATRALVQQSAAARSFSATPRTAGGAHGPQYDPPSGWLFGVKPGEKYQKEGWENPFFYGFCGSLFLAAVAYGFKPDTSIQTWALEEARRRLEVEGILEDPAKK